MKKFGARILQVLLVLVFSIIMIYLALTLTTFYRWCDRNYIPIFKNSDSLDKYIMTDLDSNYIKELGNTVENFAELMNESLDKSYYETNREYHSLAEYYDPLGYAVWSQFAIDINEITTQNIAISIFVGIAATIAYIIITSKKINNVFKFIIGYVAVMLIFPPLYMYSWTYRFWSIAEMYLNSYSKFFYIIYTIIFISIYIINYIIGKKITQKLNQVMNKKM